MVESSRSKPTSRSRSPSKPAEVKRDARAPAWAKGYDVEDLRRITTLFERHDEGLVYGTFDRYSGHDAVDDLRNDRLSLGLRDGEGVPAWACVLRELSRKHAVQDFTGRRMTLPPGTLYCTRMAFTDDVAAEAILDLLRTDGGPIAVECWQEHSGERALVARLGEGGATLAAVKIRSSSSIRGLWVSGDIEGVPQARGPGELYPKEELLTLARLPVELPRKALRALTSHPTVRDASAYATIDSSYAADGTWAALALRGFYDDPQRIEKPGEMSRRWQRDHEQDLERKPRDTDLRAGLGPALEEVLAALPCDGFERIRLMRLAPGGELSRHSDITDPDVGPSPGNVVRVHIPLISNEGCVFRSWDPDGNASSMVMRPGTATYLDVRKPHAAANMGEKSRVHLVVDCYANAATVEMLRNASPASFGRSTGNP